VVAEESHDVRIVPAANRWSGSFDLGPMTGECSRLSSFDLPEGSENRLHGAKRQGTESDSHLSA
jgi:hypothetical protein